MNTVTIAPQILDQLIGRFDCEEEVEKFISGELILIPADVAPLPKKIYLILNYDLFDLETSLTSGNFDEINPDILSANFSIEGKGIQELEFDLFRLGDSHSRADSIKEIKKDSDPENPWLPAKIEHGLLFAEAFPSVQKKHPIIVLGTILKVGTEKLIPYLSSNGADRRVCLGSYCIEWTHKVRILRYRFRTVPSD